MELLRVAVRIALVVLSLWLVAVAAAWLFQRRLIYRVSSDPPPPAGEVLSRAEDVRIPTEDGLELGAWWVPGVEPNSGVTVAVFPGNAADRENRAPLAEALSAMGHSVLLLDYRGYGGNPGTPSEAGLVRDARAAADWLASRDDVDAGAIVYLGESLGAGVAVALAAERPPAGLVLRSPFRSLVDAARYHFPILPADTLLEDRYPSVDRIASVRCPVLFVVGTEDRIVPARQSRALYDAASQPKRWFALEGARHNDLDLLAGDDVLEAVDEFLRTGISPE